MHEPISKLYNEYLYIENMSTVQMAIKKVLFLGQKPVCEAAWEMIQERDDKILDIVGVVTNKSADSVWWSSNRIARNVTGIPVIDNADRNSELILDVIDQQDVDLIISVHHPWILPAEILAAVDYNAINFHNGKLPKYKGYNPVNHAILNQDTEFGSTAHWMTDDVDDGNKIYEASFPIAPDDTAVSLYAKENNAALALLEHIFDDLAADTELPSRPLPEGGNFHSRASIDGLNEIEHADSPELDRKSRAFFFPPFEPAYIQQGENRHHILPDGAYDLLTKFGTNVRDLHEHMRETVDPVLEIN
jgi:methionyl-tRNA formyltransferase